MENNYKFIYDKEPTEKELSELMHEVAVEVKKKAEIAKIKFTENFKNHIKSTIALKKCKKV